jgi:O-antigen ligase
MRTHSVDKLNPKFLKIISLLCASLVPLLVTGPFLPDLLISCLSVWFLYYTLKNKIYNIYKNIYFYFFISFCLVCILSSLLSDDVLLSLNASLFYIRIGIFALLISYFINQNKKILDYFYYAFVITFSLLIIDGYFQYFKGVNLFGYYIGENYRVSSFFGKELILGSYLSRLFPLLIALFIAKSNKHILEIYYTCILFILIYILIFLSGERASFFFLNLSVLFIIFFTSGYKWLRFLLFIIPFCIVILLIFKDENLHNRFIKSPIESMGLNKNYNYLFSPSHDLLIKTAWKMFLDKPLLGHGPKLFRIKCDTPKYNPHQHKSCNVHPHNFYIQLLSETGIVGFLFLSGVFFYFIYIVTKHFFSFFFCKKMLLSDYQICLLSCLLITIWPLTSNGNFFNNHLMLFYSLHIGFFKK